MQSLSKLEFKHYESTNNCTFILLFCSPFSLSGTGAGHSHGCSSCSADRGSRSEPEQSFPKGQKSDDLESGFLNPPPQARPYTYWIWMNGNITREGITDDLEAMSRMGIGGVMVFNVAGSHGCDIPAGPVDYFSDDWLDLVKFTAKEAERLGIDMYMQNCAGWATTGGPWIKPENAMLQLVSAEMTLWGNRHVSQKLPHPEVFEDYYRDVAVYAFPSSMDNGYRVPQWQAKAGQRGGRSGRQPDLTPAPENAAIDKDAIIDLSPYVNKDGILTWDAPPGNWKILRLGYTPTGMTNHPAPDAGRGLEIDKLSREGLDVHWHEGIQPVLDHLGPLVSKSFRGILIDSYEAGLNQWTPKMIGEFRKRRGYDPTPYLLTLTGRLVGDAPTTERFLWDFRRTIADLFAENYYGYFADLCHERGLQFTTEPYTSCFEGLMVAAKADLPMGEFWADGGYSFSLSLAASIAHINGRTVAGAEAFTAAPSLAGWQNYPGSLKSVGDLAWTKGINRLVLHSYPHQPWSDLVPGMTMGQYGCHFDRNNTWWEPGRAWVTYLRRSQFLLQSGENVADVLCFAGDAAPNGGVNRDDIKESGYDDDACGTDILAVLKVEDGNILLPSGKRYRLLVLPDTKFLRPSLARKVRDLVYAGAKVLGPAPEYTPSLEGFPASENTVKAIGEEVWGECDGVKVTSNTYGKGQVFTGLTPAEVLSRLNIAPDVTMPADCPKLAWIHRRFGDVHIFFVSNQSGRIVQTIAGFRTIGKRPEFWDAVHGTMKPAPGWRVKGEHTLVPLSLMPDESVFVVFRQSGKSEPDPFIRVENPMQNEKDSLWKADFKVDKEVQLRAWNNGPHILHRTSGKTKKFDVTDLPDELILAGPWTVRFQHKRGAPSEARFNSLVSWDHHPDQGIRYFSGTADYSLEFELPNNFLEKNQEVWLDLGEVKVIAEVRINGKDIGILWSKPFRIEVSRALQPGSNKLEIDVTNLWVNRLIGDEQYPDDCDWSDENYLNRWPDWLKNGQPRPASSRVTFTTWKHWKKNDQLFPSGLLGPVVLRCARLIPVQSFKIDDDTVKKWSKPYRNWYYYPDLVIPSKPNIKGYEDVKMTDVPTVFQLEDNDKWYMSFIGFDGTGYQSFMAESDDLVRWGNMALAMGYGPEHEFDHGGVVLGAYLYKDYNVKAPRTLKRKDDKYYSLYGAYPLQGGYELRPGYEGLACSEDGLIWKRAKNEPVLSVYQDDCKTWEKDCIYQPWLLEYKGSYYDFYNAANGSVEQTGLALSDDLFAWERYAHNPVIPIGPKGSYNEKFSSDPKVFRDHDHWVCFFFGVGHQGAHIMIAFSRDLYHWTVDPEPLYKAGGNPSGIDGKYAHKISLVWNPADETYYMFYCAVDQKDNRGIGLITSKPIEK